MALLVRFALFLFMAALFVSPVEAESLERADGTHLTYHIVDRDNGRRQGLILMLQGSGCQPVVDRDWLRSEPAILAPGRAVLVIEKFGVGTGKTEAGEPEEGCPAAYWRGNTLQQRVLDALQVIAHLRQAEWWNGQLIIHGGSEGGAVAALLAPLVPETQAVVIVSSGIGVSVAELIRRAVPPPIAAQIPPILAEAATNPTSEKRFGGESFRWWASAANVVPARSLLQTKVPIMLIHGTRDQFAPVSTAQATKEMFRQSGRHNLTYREYEGYDHFMVDQAGVSHNDEVMRTIAAWLEARLAPT